MYLARLLLEQWEIHLKYILLEFDMCISFTLLIWNVYTLDN